MISRNPTRSKQRARGATVAGARKPIVMPWQRIRQLLLLVLLVLLLLAGQQGLRAVQAVPVGEVSLLGVSETAVAGAPGETLRREALLRLAEPHLQRGFWQLNLQTLKVAVEQHPWVRQAVVSRRWPNHLDIGIDPQLPVARWNATQLLTSSGALIDVESNAAFENLPQFIVHREGLSREQLEQLAQRFNAMQAPLLGRGLQILRFGQARSGDIWLQVDGEELAEPLRIELGIADGGLRLQRFLGFYDRQVGIDRMQLARVDLRYPNGISVAWHKAGQDLELASANNYE